MISINNESNLKIYINNILEQVISDVTKVILSALQNNIINNTYKHGGDNKSYFDGTGNPTEEFLYSFHWEDIQKGTSSLVANLIYDWHLMVLHDAVDGLPAHKSFNGTDMREQLAGLLNVDGNYASKGRMQFWEPTLAWIESNIDSLIIHHAKKYGLVLSV